MDSFFIKRAAQIWCLLIIAVFYQYSYAQMSDEDYYKSFDDCDSHYPPEENRVFLESQSWWQPDETINTMTDGPPEDFGHLRIGTCFPLNQEVSGIVQFKLQITFHNYPFSENGVGHDANFDYVDPHIYGRTSPNGEGRESAAVRSAAAVADNIPTNTEGSIGRLANSRINNARALRIGGNPGRTIREICTDAGQPPMATTDTNTCVIGLEFGLDTNVFPSDGRQEIRFFTSIIEPDTQENHVTTGWPLVLRNNVPQTNVKPERPYGGDGSGETFQIQGRGWYTGLNYVTGSIYDYDPSLPRDANWKPHIRSAKGPTLGAEVTRTRICLNPDFNAGDPGIVLLDVEGPLVLNDNDSMNPLHPDNIVMTFGELLANGVEMNGVDIDNHAFFENGQLTADYEGKPHRLAIRTEAGCDLLDPDRTNDCDCAFNARKDPSDRDFKAEGTLLLRDGTNNDIPGINNDPSCRYKDPALYEIPTDLTPPIRDGNGVPQQATDGIEFGDVQKNLDNHGQKTTSMLVFPFNFQRSGTQTPEISIDPIPPVFQTNDGDAPIDLDVNITATPEIPAGDPVIIELKTLVGSAGASNGNDFKWMNPKNVPVSGTGIEYRFDNLIFNNSDSDTGPEEFHIAVIIDDEEVARSTVTINKQADNNNSNCDDPGYDRPNAQSAMYLWQDCGTNNWHVRVAGGGRHPWHQYIGDLSSSQTFSGITGLSLEPNDEVNNASPEMINFTLGVVNKTHDGFDFTVPEGDTCLTISQPTNASILVGVNETKFTAPISFDISTLEVCQ